MVFLQDENKKLTLLCLGAISESELALLPGMFAHTRNLFWWQKLHSVTEWQRQDTDNKNNNTKDNVQNNTNTIYK